MDCVQRSYLAVNLMLGTFWVHKIISPLTGKPNRGEGRTDNGATCATSAYLTHGYRLQGNRLKRMVCVFIAAFVLASRQSTGGKSRKFFSLDVTMN